MPGRWTFENVKADGNIRTCTGTKINLNSTGYTSNNDMGVDGAVELAAGRGDDDLSRWWLEHGDDIVIPGTVDDADKE